MERDILAAIRDNNVEWLINSVGSNKYLFILMLSKLYLSGKYALINTFCNSNRYVSHECRKLCLVCCLSKGISKGILDKRVYSHISGVSKLRRKHNICKRNGRSIKISKMLEFSNTWNINTCLRILNYATEYPIELMSVPIFKSVMIQQLITFEILNTRLCNDKNKKYFILLCSALKKEDFLGVNWYTVQLTLYNFSQSSTVVIGDLCAYLFQNMNNYLQLTDYYFCCQVGLKYFTIASGIHYFGKPLDIKTKINKRGFREYYYVNLHNEDPYANEDLFNYLMCYGISIKLF